MKKGFLSFLILLFFQSQIFAQIPPGYYNNTEGLTCADLKTRLFNIISTGTTQLLYTPGVWNAFATTDMRRNDENTADIIWDMYSDNPTGPENYTYKFGFPTSGGNQCGTYTAEGQCYNREHSFPQIWFGENTYPMFSDLHALFPTDGFVNGKHDNYPFGQVGTPVYTSMNGSKLGPSSFPGFTGTVFEPIDAYKGDFARAQLYMITRYENLVAGWKSNANHADEVLSGNSYPAINPWYIKLLYKWHVQDPVSKKETDRNNAVYAIQKNRNPFIDHPEFVERIWTCTGLLPVPVSLIDLDAVNTNGSIILSWSATRETNFSAYEVERSTDGIHFEKVGVVKGQNLLKYSLTDRPQLNISNVYYRLKMIDDNGSSSYSRIISVRIDNIGKIIVFPNPVRDRLVILAGEAIPENSELKISDITGRLMVRQRIQTRQTSIGVDVHNLEPGKYFLSIQNAQKVVNESFMITR